jgi:hypothetical protein
VPWVLHAWKITVVWPWGKFRFTKHMWAAVSFTRLNLSSWHEVFVSVLLSTGFTLQQPIQYYLFSCFFESETKYQLQKLPRKKDTIRYWLARREVLKIYQERLNNNNNNNVFCCFCCLLSHNVSAWYFSWTNGDPYRSGFKFQTAVLSRIICDV